MNSSIRPPAKTLPPDLPPEHSVLLPSRKAPPADSDAYLQIHTENADVRVFNQTTNVASPVQTYRMTISGMTVRLGDTANPRLFDELQGRRDLSEVTICADVVEVLSPLYLYGTRLTLTARVLRFRGDGLIDTSPPDFDETAVVPQALMGSDAGSITIHAQTVDAPGPEIRLIARGGQGQKAQAGIVGANGQNVPEWDGTVATTTQHGGTEHLKWDDKIKDLEYRVVHADCLKYMDMSTALFQESVWEKKGTIAVGSKDPTDGRPPERMPGAPGLGGKSGTLLTNHLDALMRVTDLGAGLPGNKAADLPASIGGTPRKYCHVICAFRSYTFPHLLGGHGSGILNFRWIDGHWSEYNKTETKDFPAVPAPEPPEDSREATGQGQALPTLGLGWTNALTLAVVLSFVRDGFRAGAGAEVRPLVQTYVDALDQLYDLHTHEDVPNAQLPLEIDAARAELHDLLERIDGPNDYYGHPAGWVPALSFLSNMKAYGAETRNAIAGLYLGYWVSQDQSALADRIGTTKEAITQLSAEMQAAQEAQSAAIELLKDLKLKENKVSNRVSYTLEKLSRIEQDERTKVAGQLQMEHLLRTSAKILGGIAQVVPVGQPALGAVGGGLSALSDWDSDEPFDSITEIGSALWKSKLVEDKLLPNLTQQAKAYLDISEDAKDDEKSEFDKEVAKQKLSQKAKDHIKEQSDAKKQVTGALSGLFVSKSEIDDALAKALADCPQYQEIETDLRALEVEKETYANALLAAMDAMTAAAQTIVNARLGQIEMRASLASASQGLSPAGLAYAKSMERRALERMQRYQAYFAASYRYYWLREPEGFDPYANAVFTQLRDAFSSHAGKTLSGDEFDRLAKIFQEDLKTVADGLFTYFNTVRPTKDAGGRVTSRTLIELTPEQLADLNGPEKSVAFDPLRLGKIHLGMEDVRIFDIKVVHAELLDPPERSVEVRIRTTHADNSVFRRSGHQYLFRNTARHWQATVARARTKTEITQESSDPLDAAVLRHLLGELDKDAPLFNRPSLAGPLTVHRDLLDMASDYPAQLAALSVELDYTYRDAKSSEVALLVVTSAGVKAVISCDTVDIGGRGDGSGTFLRIFNTGSTVALTAPPTYGALRFRGWRARGHAFADGAQFEALSSIDDLADVPGGLVADTVLHLNMSEPQMVEAVYL